MGLVRDDSREVLARAIAANPGCDLVLGCREIRYISSTSFGVLLSAHRLVAQQGRRLVIVSDEPSVLDMIRMVRLDRVLTIAPDEETARELLAVQPGAAAPSEDRSVR
jgi:anti-anti-sigma factor